MGQGSSRERCKHGGGGGGGGRVWGDVLNRKIVWILYNEYVLIEPQI